MQDLSERDTASSGAPPVSHPFHTVKLKGKGREDVLTVRKTQITGGK